MSVIRQQKFLTMYKPVHDRFERFCRARVYGEMDYEDLMNETLLLAFEKMDELVRPEAFLSFLCGISVRLLANNKRKSRPELGISNDVMESIEIREGADISTDVTLLHQALSLLPDDQKEGIVLFEITGFSTKEISAIQACSEATVRKRISRARQKLKEVLTRELNYELRNKQAI